MSKFLRINLIAFSLFGFTIQPTSLTKFDIFKRVLAGCTAFGFEQAGIENLFNGYKRWQEEREYRASAEALKNDPNTLASADKMQDLAEWVAEIKRRLLLKGAASSIAAGSLFYYAFRELPPTSLTNLDIAKRCLASYMIIGSSCMAAGYFLRSYDNWYAEKIFRERDYSEDSIERCIKNKKKFLRYGLGYSAAGAGFLMIMRYLN